MNGKGILTVFTKNLAIASQLMNFKQGAFELFFTTLTLSRLFFLLNIESELLSLFDLKAHLLFYSLQFASFALNLSLYFALDCIDLVRFSGAQGKKLLLEFFLWLGFGSVGEYISGNR
jgi:hypothetical protein